MITNKRRDWFRILRDLMSAGVSMSDVARKTGREPQTVQRWAGGSDPKDTDARTVLGLYAKHCPDAYEVHEREFAIHVQRSTTRVGRVVGALVEHGVIGS